MGAKRLVVVLLGMRQLRGDKRKQLLRWSLWQQLAAWRRERKSCDEGERKEPEA
ncbi:hypothetical protein WN944_002615 [Citrus x changshan-huyou]|uniref:Uncharacterized protein n=1 Tax=Citrus x changshan-huyou TaxID=2935761 RepID=A0AAP0MIW4_9ROSI